LHAPEILPPDSFGLSGTAAGDIVKMLGIFSGIFLLLFSFWFFCISTVAVLAGIRHMSFNLKWWAFIFPLAGLTLAAVEMGEAFESKAIDGICSALTIILVILWLVTAVVHVWAVWHGTIMWPGKDEDMEEE
jgi:tellurite resistance protein TehA-like permease